MSEKRIYKIFISSTYEDLKEERQRAISTILKLGHIPVSMEFFSSEKGDKWGLMRKRIEECDIYTLMIGSRYGSVDKFGIGYVEKEYSYAKELQMPICVQMLELDETKADDTHRLKKFREVITDDQLISPSKDSTEMLTNLSINIANQSLKMPIFSGWVKNSEINNDKFQKISTLNNNSALSDMEYSLYTIKYFFELESKEGFSADFIHICKTYDFLNIADYKSHIYNCLTTGNAEETHRLLENHKSIMDDIIGIWDEKIIPCNNKLALSDISNKEEFDKKFAERRDKQYNIYCKLKKDTVFPFEEIELIKVKKTDGDALFGNIHLDDNRYWIPQNELDSDKTFNSFTEILTKKTNNNQIMTASAHLIRFVIGMSEFISSILPVKKTFRRPRVTNA